MKMLLTVASAVAGLVAGTLVPVGHAFAADQLTITSYGGHTRQPYARPISSLFPTNPG